MEPRAPGVRTLERRVPFQLVVLGFLRVLNVRGALYMGPFLGGGGGGAGVYRRQEYTTLI